MEAIILDDSRENYDEGKKKQSIFINRGSGKFPANILLVIPKKPNSTIQGYRLRPKRANSKTLWAWNENRLVLFNFPSTIITPVDSENVSIISRANRTNNREAYIRQNLSSVATIFLLAKISLSASSWRTNLPSKSSILAGITSRRYSLSIRGTCFVHSGPVTGV